MKPGLARNRVHHIYANSAVSLMHAFRQKSSEMATNQTHDQSNAACLDILEIGCTASGTLNERSPSNAGMSHSKKISFSNKMRSRTFHRTSLLSQSNSPMNLKTSVSCQLSSTTLSM